MRPYRRSVLASLVLAGLSVVPAIALAQGAPQQTHTVKKGDTLWDIAQTYLGDPFRWPEIYRRNTETVKDPNLIYPDQVLIISGDVAASPGTPADAPAPTAEPTPTPMPTPDAPMVPVQNAPQASGGAPRPMTIFNPDRYRMVRGARESVALRSRGAAVRPGDFTRAPFLWEANGVAGTGKVGKAVGDDGVAPTQYERPVQLYERVHVELPKGATGAKNEQFLVVRYGPVLSGAGQVVIPTGIIKLFTDAAGGRAEAGVVTKYEDVFAGQMIIPLETSTLAAGVYPTRVEFGAKTTLLWMQDNPIMPSLGQYVMLSGGASSGIVPGDQVTIQRDMGIDDKGVPIPPEEVAVLQIVRVTTWGASAILISQTDGVVNTGMTGRITAKMP
ncbi:MAG: LysM peptidoglycan-binding domain-containing protein [Gemmatimonadaceae bacterium]